MVNYIHEMPLNLFAPQTFEDNFISFLKKANTENRIINAELKHATQAWIPWDEEVIIYDELRQQKFGGCAQKGRAEFINGECFVLWYLSRHRDIL